MSLITTMLYFPVLFWQKQKDFKGMVFIINLMNRPQSPALTWKSHTTDQVTLISSNFCINPPVNTDSYLGHQRKFWKLEEFSESN